jgi:hypothetical protein
VVRSQVQLMHSVRDQRHRGAGIESDVVSCLEMGAGWRCLSIKFAAAGERERVTELSVCAGPSGCRCCRKRVSAGDAGRELG